MPVQMRVALPLLTHIGEHPGMNSRSVLGGSFQVGQKTRHTAWSLCYRVLRTDGWAMVFSGQGVLASAPTWLCF